MTANSKPDIATVESIIELLEAEEAWFAIELIQKEYNLTSK